MPAYKAAAAKNDYVFSITANSAEIADYINDVSVNNSAFDTMFTQVKTYNGPSEGTSQIKQVPTGFVAEVDPRFAVFASDKFLSKMALKE